jgi:aspartokinase-like uncharacterized kinase
MSAVATNIFAGPGFDSLEIDAAIKFGGSLLFDTTMARELAIGLCGAARRHRLVLIPGGGPTDKLIEKIAREIGLATEQINPACMRAMDQTGILLSNLAPCFRQVETVRAVREALREERLPILLPSKMVLDLDLFIRHDLITSDTIGAFLAFLMGARRYIVLTDVDGVYHRLVDGRPDGEPIDDIGATELSQLGHTSVDACLGPFLSAVGLQAHVVNGKRIADVLRVISGEGGIGTAIRP